MRMFLSHSRKTNFTIGVFSSFFVLALLLAPADANMPPEQGWVAVVVRAFAPSVPDIEARTARDTFIAPLKNKNRFYVSVGSGIVRVIEFDSSFFFQYNDSKLNTQSRIFHDGWAGSLRIGYRLNDHLRGELEYAYSKVALRSLHDFARPFPDFIIPGAPRHIETEYYHDKWLLAIFMNTPTAHMS